MPQGQISDDELDRIPERIVQDFEGRRLGRAQERVVHHGEMPHSRRVRHGSDEVRPDPIDKDTKEGW